MLKIRVRANQNLVLKISKKGLIQTLVIQIQ